VVQERSHAWGTTRAGLRLERARVRSDGDAPGTYPAEARFGDPAARSFAPRSASLEHVLPLMKDGSNGLDLQASLAHTERAPTAFELYANGLHASTAAFERGDPTLGVERGRNLELALSGRFDGLQLRAGVWWSRFARYVALDATGATIDVPNEEGGVDPIPEFLFRAVPARLNGGELEGSWQTQQGAWSLKFTGSLDTVRSTNTDTGQPLPRLPPWRGAVAVQATQGPWSLRTELRHAAAQNRVEAVDTTTPGYTLLNLQASWRMPLGGGAGAAGAGREVLWFASLNNATDALAFNAATVSTARGLSPLAGRSWRVGARVEF
jgi:iron complex outermembrane receptor protein